MQPNRFQRLASLVVLVSGACLAVSLPTCAWASDFDQLVPDADGFVSIFDGRSLKGWYALPAASATDWSVQGGVIAGRGSADRLSYLVWNELLTNFELRLQYRMRTDGNTGVEVRAQRDSTGKRPFEGYHADLGHVGIGPQILGAWDFHFATRKEPPCPRGTILVIGQKGELRSTQVPNPLKIDDIRRRDWNSVRIVARGTHFRFYINHKLAAEFHDNAREGRLDRGQIGLQLHDQGMHVEFRNLRVRRLPLLPR